MKNLSKDVEIQQVGRHYARLSHEYQDIVDRCIPRNLAWIEQLEAQLANLQGNRRRLCGDQARALHYRRYIDAEKGQLRVHNIGARLTYVLAAIEKTKSAILKHQQKITELEANAESLRLRLVTIESLYFPPGVA